MNIFQKLFGRRGETRAATSIEYISTLAAGDSIFNWAYSAVNPTVELCKIRIARTLGSIKPRLYLHRRGGGRSLAVGHPLFSALRNPDPGLTPLSFYSQVINDILEGNAYILINKVAGQYVFQRLEPSKVRLTIEQGRKVFSYGTERLFENKVLHIPYPYEIVNGRGISPEEKYRDLIALDNAISAYIKAYFGNSMGKRYGIKPGDRWADKPLDEVYQIFAPAIQKFVIGAMNSGKPFILPAGASVETIDQTLNLYSDVRSLKEHVERQIAQAYGIPYSLVSEQNKYGSLEANQLQLLADAIEPLGAHIAQSFERLLDPLETAFYVAYDYMQLLNSDPKTTVDYLAREVQSGLLTINEAREKLELDGVEGGDTPLVPANQWPLTQANIDAFFAQSKAALHNAAGDDKQ